MREGKVMSRYTLRLCDVCEVLYNEKDYYLNNTFENMVLPDLENPFNAPDIDTIISKVRTKIFDFDYPKPNNSDETKKALETKIIKHYYMREIGFGSWGRFKLALNEKLNLIMPYFNDLYKDYIIEIVKARRNVNSDGEKRGKVDELLIHNYERKEIGLF